MSHNSIRIAHNANCVGLAGRPFQMRIFWVASGVTVLTLICNSCSIGRRATVLVRNVKILYFYPKELTLSGKLDFFRSNRDIISMNFRFSTVVLFFFLIFCMFYFF